jgi:hypothetical protein
MLKNLLDLSIAVTVTASLVLANVRVLAGDILEITAYLDSELLRQPSSGWVALSEKNGSWYLSNALARFTTRDDDLAVEVQSNIPNTHFLLRGTDVKLGRVNHIAIESQYSPTRAIQTQEVKFGSSIYRFVWDEKPPQGSVQYANLIVEQGKQRQVFGTQGDVYSGIREILWAGDLDGDAKLDLILDVSSDKWGATEVYLSKGAPPGRLMRLVARRIAGC